MGTCGWAGVTPGTAVQAQRKANDAHVQNVAKIDLTEDIRRQIPFVNDPFYDVKGGTRGCHVYVGIRRRKFWNLYKKAT